MLNLLKQGDFFCLKFGKISSEQNFTLNFPLMKLAPEREGVRKSGDESEEERNETISYFNIGSKWFISKKILSQMQFL